MDLFSLVAIILSVIAIIKSSNVATDLERVKHWLGLHRPPQQHPNNQQPIHNHNQSQQAPAQQTIHNPQYAQPTQTQHAMSQHTHQKTKSSIEKVLGKNVLSILATVLIFIGAITFGALVFPGFSDPMKSVSLFTVSALITGIGLFMARKGASVLNNCVAGCGLGLAFISIFVTHLLFGLISPLATYGLVIAWMGIISLLSHKFQLKSLPFVALAGCMMCSIYGFTIVTTSNTYIELTMYQLFAFSCLILSHKKNILLFKLSSLSLMFLNSLLSIITALSPQFNMDSMLNIFVCVSLMLCNTAIYILSTKCAKISEENSELHTLDIVMTNINHACSLLCTIIIPINVFVHDVLQLSATAADSAFIIPVTAIISTITIAYMLIIKDNRKRFAAFLTSEIILYLTWLLDPISLPNGLWVCGTLSLVVLNLVIHKMSGSPSNKRFLYAGMGLLIADIVTSFITTLESMSYGWIYSIALLVVILLYTKAFSQRIIPVPAIPLAFVYTHLFWNVYQAFNRYDIHSAWAIMLIFAVHALIILYPKIRKHQFSAVSFCIEEGVVSLFTGIFILYLALKPTSIETKLLAILLIPYAQMHLPYIIKSKDSTLNVIACIRFTLTILSVLAVCTTILEQAFVCSLVLMGIAVACIIFGFAKQLKPTRIYGLVLTILSVFKMMIIDVWNQTSITRVLALMAGGIICFSISAIYNKVEKMQSTKVETLDS